MTRWAFVNGPVSSRERWNLSVLTRCSILALSSTLRCLEIAAGERLNGRESSDTVQSDHWLIWGHGQQFFRQDWKIAHPPSGRVVDRVRDRRRHARNADFPNPTSTQRIENCIGLVDEMDIHVRDIRI